MIKRTLYHVGVCASLLLAFTGCHSKSHLVEPQITYIPQKKQFDNLPSDFKELNPTELESDWAKELKLGLAFAKDFDFFRAITCLKRSLFLMPPENTDRHMQAEFVIMQCYYLGQKYREAIEIFDSGKIRQATSAFPPFRDMLIILYDCYRKTDQYEKAEVIMYLMEKGDPETAIDLKLSSAMYNADTAAIQSLSQKYTQPEVFSRFLNNYHADAKSVTKAQFLNAILPGAGYYYVGQTKTAVTSLLLNTSFIAATYYFFERGNWGAGIFTASMEFGWYFGGINGAGLAAKEYNECLYRNRGKDLMIKNSLFPVLMLQTGF